jgi:oligopeptide/dipeptide ABC transporter ATP-binding protein
VARALAFAPKLIVCDEPVSALDVSIQAQIINLLADLQSELGLTYIFIAHDLSVVRHVSNSVAVMYLGKLAEVSPVEELWAHPRHPYADALLSAVPIPDPEYAGRRERIILVGDVPSPISPPSGCRFHPRCPKARQACVDDEPVMAPRLGDEPEHRAACHFPVEDGEDISKSRPSISADQRVIETGLVAGS